MNTQKCSITQIKYNKINQLECNIKRNVENSNSISKRDTIALDCHIDTTNTQHNTNYQEYFWNWVIDVNCKFKHCSLTTQK